MKKIKLPAEPRRIRLPRARSRFFHLHAHSRFSVKDALPSVEDMVTTAVENNQPGLALTDHGNMAGSVQLYIHARERGIAPFPGVEAYLKRDVTIKDDPRFHVGLVAFGSQGYEALVKLSSKSHMRTNFHHKPHVDFADFAEWSERGWTNEIALTTGCFFGMVIQTLLSQGEDAAEWLIKTLATWFPRTYVELQNHNIDHGNGVVDDDIVAALVSIAARVGLPVVITQDAHYCSMNDKPVHETLKRLISWSDDADDAVFPGDSFHLASEGWMRAHYSEGVWNQGLEGLGDLLNRNSLVIPELENYHYNVPIVTAGDPLEELRGECVHQLTYGRSGLDTNRYWDRFNEELDVVKATNMAGYLMLNAYLCDWMSEEGIFYQARGSASGSLLCWLLGITQFDPIKEGLRYERFLSKDRTKPPDIDLDVEDSRRSEVIDWLGQRFNVCQIGTWSEFSVHHDTGRGSLLVNYLSRMRKSGVDPAYVNSIKNLFDLPKDDQRELLALGEKESFSSYGTHAGGLVITSTREEFERLVPTMLVASSDTRVTQYDGDDIEELGLLKEDILGQQSLSTLRRAVELTGRDVRDGWEWIPINDKETFRAIRQQRVEGVFQLEGYACRMGCKEMRVKSLKDVIHLVALYRPATMDTGVKDVYIQRLAGWEKVPVRHDILNKHLKETYGVPVLQDQVIAILRDIGFTPDDLTAFLKAVKASNENIGNAAEVIRGYQEMFVELAEESGFSDRDINFTWDAIQGFSKYGFNKAHATAYGHRAYYMAYLKVHHPLEFHAALLQTHAGTPKEKDYILATRDAGIPMLGPDVNISGPTWSIDHDRGAIRKGLVSIKGVGIKAANEIARHAPFTDLDDLISRCDARAVNGGKSYQRYGTLNGVLKKLEDAKALKGVT